jgi:hypothetical protein
MESITKPVLSVLGDDEKATRPLWARRQPSALNL